MLESPGSALRNCDGFGGVSRSGDGVLRAGRSVDAIGRMEPNFQHPIAYCDRALLVLSDYPQYWLRRASVLQSRAIHRLMVNDVAGAIIDLDSADGLVPRPLDMDYLRTLDVNAKLIRALALAMRGEHDAGEALALEARTQRPYSRAALLATYFILSQREASAQAAPVVTELSRLDPRWHTALPGSLTGRALSNEDLRAFFMLMLDPESPERRTDGAYSSRSVTSLARARDVLRGRCGAAPPVDASLLQVCEFSVQTTSAALEEHVLYRAAQRAIAEGGAYFVIESRRDISHWAVSPYSRTNDQSGYESHLIIRVRGDSENCPRCIDANQVLRDLSAQHEQPR